MLRDDTHEHFFTLRFNHYDYPQIHEHKYWEFMLVTSGSYVHHINNTRDIIEKNTLCLIRPTDVHSIVTNEPQSTHINFALSDDQMSLMLDSLSPSLYKKMLHGPLPAVKISDRQTNLYMQLALKYQTLQLDELLPQIFLHFITDIYTLFVLTQKDEMQRDIPFPHFVQSFGLCIFHSLSPCRFDASAYCSTFARVSATIILTHLQGSMFYYIDDILHYIDFCCKMKSIEI